MTFGESQSPGQGAPAWASDVTGHGCLRAQIDQLAAGSVTAPCDASATSRAYLASTPLR